MPVHEVVPWPVQLFSTGLQNSIAVQACRLQQLPLCLLVVT